MSATTADAGLPPLPAALPMQAGPPTQLVSAPPVAALPIRRYIGFSRPARERERYAYLDRASDVQDEIGDAPPDYRYDNDDGVSPWAWETRGGDYRYAEPADDGYRDYYYQRGADSPYLVRTHDHSYAYAGGVLVAIYLLNGALVSPDRYGGYRDEASRYFWRGQELRHAAEQRQHQGVIAANWAAQRPQFSAEQARWAQARSQQPEWQAYHAQNDPSRQRDWQQEHQQRQQVAQQFAGWQSHGFAGTPPPVLAAAGTRAALPPAVRQQSMIPVNGRPPVASQPAMAGTSGFFGPQPSHRPDLPAPQGVAIMPNNAVATVSAREQQLAAQRKAQQQALISQHQALASQRLAQEASRAQQEAMAQRQAAAARQQQLAARSVVQQQALASQRAEQEAIRARQQAAAQQQGVALREQRLAARQAALQQEAAAHEQQLAARRAALQQEAAAREQQLVARRDAQLQVLASQRAEQAAAGRGNKQQHNNR